MFKFFKMSYKKVAYKHQHVANKAALFFFLHKIQIINTHHIHIFNNYSTRDVGYGMAVSQRCLVPS